MAKAHVVVVREPRPDDKGIAPVGGTGEQGVLELDGAPLLVGSRSRIVSVANDLRVQERPVRVVLARGKVLGDRVSMFEWSTRSSVLVYAAHCFGNVTVKHVRAGHHVHRQTSLRVGDGAPLIITLQNRLPKPSAVAVVLLVERQFSTRPISVVKLTPWAAYAASDAHPRSIARWADEDATRNEATTQTSLGLRSSMSIREV